MISILITSVILKIELDSRAENATVRSTRALGDILYSESVAQTNPLRVKLTQGKDGSFLCDPISVFLGKMKNVEEMRERYGKELYFCADPCYWSDVKAYYGNDEINTDPRFGAKVVVREQKEMQGGRPIYWLYGKNLTKRRLWLLNVTILNVQPWDAGKYYCAWAITGKDVYQEVYIDVVMSKPDEAIKEAMADLFPDPHTIPKNASEEDLDYIMSSDLGDNIKEVRAAKAKCGGNHACALALLQRYVLREEVRGDCWVCMQMHSAWRTQPLTTEMLTHGCEMPKQMSLIIRMSDNLKANRPFDYNLTEYNCYHPGMPFRGPMFSVQSHLADLCICSVEGTHYVGMSDCKNTITIGPAGASTNCTLQYENLTIEYFQCPFTHLDSAPGMMWTCGNAAYYHLDKGDWTGCCYPSLISTGTTILSKHLDSTQKSVKGRVKREVSSRPDHYSGYKMDNPWTSPWENVGWSLAGLFTGVGTTTALNKINGLAWQVLSLENETVQALEVIKGELKKMREAVIQHRLVLDMLTAEKGGVCKMLSVSCCFHIPDGSENITDIIGHMREAIPKPEEVTSEWLTWFQNLWGGWGSWIVSTVVPVMLMIFLVLSIVPCLLQCVAGMITKAVKRVMMPSATYQVMTRAHTEQYVGPRLNIVPDSDCDSDSEGEYVKISENAGYAVPSACIMTQMTQMGLYVAQPDRNEQES
ncbi:MAG: hypothetical protein ACRCVE_00145 [Plesiomonas sp.]